MHPPVQFTRPHTLPRSSAHTRSYVLSEPVSEAPDWRWQRMPKLPTWKGRDRKTMEDCRLGERLHTREVKGEPTRELKKYLLERGEEL